MPRRRPLSPAGWNAIASIVAALITAAVTLATHFWTPAQAREPAPRWAPSPSVASDATPTR